MPEQQQREGTPEPVWLESYSSDNSLLLLAGEGGCRVANRSLSKLSPLLSFLWCHCEHRMLQRLWLLGEDEVPDLSNFSPLHPFNISTIKGIFSGEKSKVIWGTVSTCAPDFPCNFGQKVVPFWYLSFFSIKLEFQTHSCNCANWV